MTVGIFDGIDATLVASPVFEVGASGDDEASGTVQAGLKWQLLKSEPWNVSLTPAIGIGATGLEEFDTTIPIQVECTRGGISLGTDAAYVAVAGGDDAWRAGEYATINLNPDLTLAFEVHAAGVVSSRRQSLESAAASIGRPCPTSISKLQPARVYSRAERRAPTGPFTSDSNG